MSMSISKQQAHLSSSSPLSPHSIIFPSRWNSCCWLVWSALRGSCTAQHPALIKESMDERIVLLLLITIFFTCRGSMSASMEFKQSKKCYSCASENMKENFLSRSRGPPGRVREPKIYDSMCDLDSWLIREKSAVECQGACFKWQQVLNNSGVLSYATIRDCSERMFDPSIGPTPSPGSNYTTDCKHVQSPLTCLDHSSIEEYTCFCVGEDFCNFAFSDNEQTIYGGVLLPISFSLLLFFIF